jgi:hypothetical protein
VAAVCLTYPRPREMGQQDGQLGLRRLNRQRQLYLYLMGGRRARRR